MEAPAQDGRETTTSAGTHLISRDMPDFEPTALTKPAMSTWA